MRYELVQTPLGVEVTPTTVGGGAELSVAFRRAKIAAGWEAEVPMLNGRGWRGEPVCRNLRSEHGAFTPRTVRP